MSSRSHARAASQPFDVLDCPIARIDFAGLVGQFLDEAERAGLRHVTFLSAYGIEHAPPQVALRAVELDLASRPSMTHSILRPAWFMQNFSETFLKPINDEIVVPCGTGAEAFVSAEDIDRHAWIGAMTQAGVPAEYGEVLRMLTETVASGRGAQPNGDVLLATGRAPVRFADFAATTAKAWR